MLTDPTLKRKFENYLERSIELSEKEVKRTEKEKRLHQLALFYRRFFKETANHYEKVAGNILKEFGELQERGVLEIVTSGATHGLLPALQAVKESVKTQIKVAVKNYQKHFGRSPRGIWLPECGYYPEVEEILRENGIEFFFLDTHGILYGKPFPPYGVYSAVKTPMGLLAFGRDPQSSKQVWSSKEGYPGDPYYRDFYRDIGFDAPLDYIKPYINPDGTRTYTGFKYYRVTGHDVDLGRKELYSPEKAMERAKVHADHFHFCRDLQVKHLKELFKRPPVIVAPFDAELFGHWWFEGPQFLYHLFKDFKQYRIIKAINARDYKELFPENPESQPSTSSWGDKGYFDVWINGKNDWIYRHLTAMALTLNDLKKTKKPTPYTTRVLNQMLRELLLAQSSDWPFLITTGTAGGYAEKRVKEHIVNFFRLKELLAHEGEHEFLRKLEEKNSIFPELNFWEDWG